MSRVKASRRLTLIVRYIEGAGKPANRDYDSVHQEKRIAGVHEVQCGRSQRQRPSRQKPPLEISCLTYPSMINSLRVAYRSADAPVRSTMVRQPGPAGGSRPPKRSAASASCRNKCLHSGLHSDPGSAKSSLSMSRLLFLCDTAETSHGYQSDHPLTNGQAVMSLNRAGLEICSSAKRF